MSQSQQIETLISTVAALEARIAALEAAQPQQRDRGPKSETEMTEQHAFDVKFGIHAKLSHKAAAEALKLSYGQIYSCRGGYTFKQVKADWKSPKAQPEAQPQPDAQPQS